MTGPSGQAPTQPRAERWPSTGCTCRLRGRSILVRGRRGRHRSQFGQGIVEMSLIVAVVLFLFLGVYTAADLINDQDTVYHAARQGARLAAELGNGGYSSSNPATGCQQPGHPEDPCAVDQEILHAVLPILQQQLSHATVTEIDIYRPQPCPPGSDWGSGCPPDNGAWVSGDLIDRYNPDGTVVNGTTPQYTLDVRTQQHPNEASIGVRILYHYTSPTMALFTMDGNQYAVVRLAPVF
jgi:hypothetical protein